MSDLTRDDLAAALTAVREEAAGMGDIRVGMETLNGAIENLTTEVRLSITTLVEARKEESRQRQLLEARVTVVERWQWRVAGMASVVGLIAGGALGTTIA